MTQRTSIKFLFSLVLFVSISILSFSKAGADDAVSAPETKAKIDGVLPTGNAVPGAESVDDLITNNKLRALSGSKSRWSIASAFNYYGGTISEPLAQDRPNISGASGTTHKSALDGSVSAKYSLSPTNSLLAGIGLRWVAPLAGGALTNYKGTTFDATNPYATFQHIYKWAGIQSVLQASLMQWTAQDVVALGYAQQVYIDQENMYELGKTKITVGASTALQYNTFSKTGADLAGDQSIYAFTVAPILEYQLSSKVNLRTLVNVFTYEHYANQANAGDFVHDAIYQSIGVGVSVTRDVFLYPNIQFLPGNLQADVTNVGMSATVNLF